MIEDEKKEIIKNQKFHFEFDLVKSESREIK